MLSSLFEFIEFQPRVENFASEWSREASAIFTNYYLVLLLTRTNSFILFLGKIFGSFRFVPYYLPLFSFNLFGFNLEFESTIRRGLLLISQFFDFYSQEGRYLVTHFDTK